MHLWYDLLSSRDEHCDVVPVEQDLVQFGDLPALRGALKLCYVLQHYVWWEGLRQGTCELSLV